MNTRSACSGTKERLSAVVWAASAIRSNAPAPAWPRRNSLNCGPQVEAMTSSEPGGTWSFSSDAIRMGASGSQFGARLYWRMRSAASAKSRVPSGPTRARAGSWKVVARPR